MRKSFGRSSTSLGFCLVLLGALLPVAATAGTACVWRVANIDHPFYLVGTIHALSGNDYPLPKPYDEALRNSQRLVFELQPDPKSDFPEKFDVAATYPKGDDIRHHVHAKTWEFLAKNFKYSEFFGHMWRFGQHHIEGVEQLRPWAIAYFVWGIHGYNDVFGEHGVDHYLAYQGRRSGKEIAALETTDEHIAVLSGMSDIESELILLDTLTRGDKRREDFNQLRAAWKKGDTATMWQLHQRERKINPGADARLLDLRNVKWIPRIKAEINSGKPTAIVAGSAHFIGYNGVVTLLEHQGYKIEQL
jgi:uncharacterized protein YbaP (TraB family)